MGKLYDKIRNAVNGDRYAISSHADDRLRERRIALWQIVSGAGAARLLSERPDDQPNPSIELEQSLADGTPVKVVWSWVENHRLAVLVTVHYL